MDYLKYLNTRQYEAVTAKDKRILVLAGAGSGKTRVLTTKVNYTNKISNLLNEYIDQTISEEEYKEKVNSYNKKVDEINERLNNFSEEIVREKMFDINYPKFIDTLKNLPSNINDLDLIRALTYGCKVTRENRKYSIEIKYKFN